MAGFTATPEQLQQAAVEMENKNQELQRVLTQFISGAEGISGMWQGQAERAFQTLSQRFHADANKLNEALLQMSGQMTDTSRTYAEQEAANQASMSNITNTLGG